MTDRNGPSMGTVAWGERAKPHDLGRLTLMEKTTLVARAGLMAGLEVADFTLEALGSINTFGSDLEGLQPPDTPLVRDALDFADDVQSIAIMRHSRRTYYWAMLLGGYRKLEINREILFSAAILHDVGLARGRTSQPGECCFVVYGARRCEQHLLKCGHAHDKVRSIADAIGLHLNVYVSDRLHGTEAHLLSRGAMCDVFGFGRRRISKSTRKEVFSSHPQGDLINDLEIWKGHHLKGTRGDFLINLGGKSGSPAPKNLKAAAE